MTVKSSNFFDDHHHDDDEQSALGHANNIQKAVHTVGFQFPTIDHVFEKLTEEAQELKEAIASNDRNHIREELGDLLFVAALLARHCDIDAEDALKNANLKFITRFTRLEEYLKNRDITLEDATLEQLQSAWKSIKGDTQTP